MRKIVLCIVGTLTINCGTSDGGTRIGPSGGVVEGPNGARIEIPEGALSEDVEIGIRLADSSDLEGINWSALETTVDDRFVTAEVTSFSFFQPGASAPKEEEEDGVAEAGDAYEVTPHGQRFQEPVEVTIPYTQSRPALALFRNYLSFCEHEVAELWYDWPGRRRETNQYDCEARPTTRSPGRFNREFVECCEDNDRCIPGFGCEECARDIIPRWIEYCAGLCTGASCVEKCDPLDCLFDGSNN